MTRYNNTFLAVVLILYFPAPALADHHDKILPYLGDDVVAAAYVDLTQVDLPATVRQLEELDIVSESDGELAVNVAAAAQEMIDRFRKLGLRQIYALLRTADVAHGGPSWVLTVGSGGDADAIIAELRPLVQSANVHLPGQFKADSGVILAAVNESQLQAVNNNRVAAGEIRDSVRDAIESLAGHDAGVVVFGDADSRRVVREMFPRLPAPFDAIDGRLIADGLHWGGASINLPPNLQLSIMIQADQPGTAERVKDAAYDVIQKGKAAAREKPQMLPPGFIEALSLLRPTVDGARVMLTIGTEQEGFAALSEVLGESIANAQQAAERTQRVNNFKQIGLALLNYEASQKSFPYAATTDDDGRPLLSWRVAILPYLDEMDLYKQFRLDEPWDSPHNRELIAKMPNVYADPDPTIRRTVGGGKTTFVVPTGPKTVFRNGHAATFKEIIDGTSNTVLTVEVVPGRSVVWTQPEDWEVDFANPLDGVLRSDVRPFTVGFCDGSVRILDPEHPADRKNWPLYLQFEDRQSIER